MVSLPSTSARAAVVPPTSPRRRLWDRINFRVLYTLVSALIILAGTLVAIQYAKGNFRFTKKGYVAAAGLLNANSFPTAAEVFIDEKLVTATDNTLYLEPGNYHVKIVKDGYSTWEKNLSIEHQLVTQTNAQLFPAAPSLTPLTFTGVADVNPSPDGQKLLYRVASASSQAKVGLYVLELSNGPGGLIGMQKAPRLVLDGIQNSNLTSNLAEASYIWSPDSAEVLISTPKGDWLIPTDRKSTFSTLTDIGLRKKTILAEWEQDMYLRERQFMIKFPPEILQIATTSAKNVYLSPDKKRLMYTATASATLADHMVPALPASSTQPEVRTIQPGKIYVYDREEDKNFEIATAISPTPTLAALPIPSETAKPASTQKKTSLARPTQLTPTPTPEPTNASSDPAEKRLLATDLANAEPQSLTASPSAFQTLQASSSAQTALNFNVYYSSLYINTLQWFPDSRHVLFIRDGKIQVMEYDGTNLTTLYAGPFANFFTYPWPDGSRLLILTRFSPDSPLNLYTIELK